MSIENKKIEALLLNMELGKEKIESMKEEIANNAHFIRVAKLSDTDKKFHEDKLSKLKENSRTEIENLHKEVKERKEEIKLEKQTAIEKVKILSMAIEDSKKAKAAEEEKLAAREKMIKDKVGKVQLKNYYKKIKDANLTEIERLEKDESMPEKKKNSKIAELKKGIGDIETFFNHNTEEMNRSKALIEEQKKNIEACTTELEGILEGKTQEEYIADTEKEIKVIEDLNFGNIDKTREFFENERASKTEPEKPKTEPEKPKTEPEKPKTEPEKPETEPEKPETEPEKPETEPEKPETEPEKPETEPEKPKTEPEKPETEPEKPETEPEKPETEPEKPETEPEKPETEPEKPETEPEKPETEPEKPETEPEKPETEPEKPETEPEKPETEPEKPETEPEKPETEPEKPETEPEKPETEPEKPKTEPEKPETEPEKPETEPEKPETEPKTAEIPKITLDAKTGKLILERDIKDEKGEIRHSVITKDYEKSLKDKRKFMKALKLYFKKHDQKDIAKFLRKAGRKVNPSILEVLFSTGEAELFASYLDALRDNDAGSLAFEYDIKLDEIDNEKTFRKVNKQALKDNKNLGTDFAAIKHYGLKKFLSRFSDRWNRGLPQPVEPEESRYRDESELTDDEKALEKVAKYEEYMAKKYTEHSIAETGPRRTSQGFKDSLKCMVDTEKAIKEAEEKGAAEKAEKAKRDLDTERTDI